MAASIIDHPVGIGTEVRWVSQAHGTWKEKRGVVKAFVPARHHIASCWRAPAAVPASRLRFGGSVSSHDRYVVEVTDERGRVWYYAPRASAVRPVTDSATDAPLTMHLTTARGCRAVPLNPNAPEASIREAFRQEGLPERDAETVIELARKAKAKTDAPEKHAAHHG